MNGDVLEMDAPSATPATDVQYDAKRLLIYVRSSRPYGSRNSLLSVQDGDHFIKEWAAVAAEVIRTGLAELHLHSSPLLLIL